jgi:hypothetical protein
MACLGIAGAVWLGGCAPMQWAKPDASAEQVRADEEECFRASVQEARARTWTPMAGPIFAPSASGGGAMMLPSGSMVDPYGQQMLEEHRLEQFCMEAKGYKLVPAP